jgi:NTE family protein
MTMKIGRLTIKTAVLLAILSLSSLPLCTRAVFAAKDTQFDAKNRSLEFTPGNAPFDHRTGSVHPNNRPTIAVALGGGGTRGAADIGILRVFEREHIPVDYIAGCSMGSIIGGLYSAGMSLDQIEETLLDKRLQHAYAPNFITAQLLLMALSNVENIFRDRPYAGLFSGKKFAQFLDKNLPESKKNIEETNIPFVAVCTNLVDGKAYKLAKGDMAHAILASSALPPIVRPVYINGALYVDGGVRANAPVESAKQFGADLTIAVSTDEQLRPEPLKKFTTVKGVAGRVTDIILAASDSYHLAKADLVIAPDVNGISIISKKKSDVEKSVAAGEKAAEDALPKIRAAMAEYLAKGSSNQKSVSVKETTKVSTN